MLASAWRVGGVSSTTPLLVGRLAALTIHQHADVHHHLERRDLKRFLGIERSNRAKANRNTHINERMFRRMRGRKTVVVTLPDDTEDRRLELLDQGTLRTELLKKGIHPYRDVNPREWKEKQMTLQSLYSVADPYVGNEQPLPWSGGSSLLETIREKGEEARVAVSHKYHNWQNGTKRIKKREGFETFNTKTFGLTADTIYEDAHRALQERDLKALHSTVTPFAYAKMWPDVERGSVKWSLVEKCSPSKVVSVRVADFPQKSGNDIAQIIVKMHTKQMVSMYDRFGLLILGSETEPREVIEYVVFENHIAMSDGKWRLHDKVYPRWAQKKTPAIQTFPIDTDQREASATNLPLRMVNKPSKSTTDEEDH